MPKPKSDLMASVVRTLAEDVDSPRSLAVWLCFQHSPRELLELPMPASAARSPSEFQLDYFITEYLSKYKGLGTKIDTRSVALSKWKQAEEQCALTNRVFRNLQLRPFTGRVEEVLFRAQRKIAACLGPLGKTGRGSNLPRILSGCKWGPGATADIPRRDATPDKKMTKPVSTTLGALPYIRAVLESDPHWAGCLLGVIPEGRFSLTPAAFKVVRGARFTTVAKSAKTDRCIAMEPTGNSFLQQGVHDYMRWRLKRFGVDLSDQTVNQRRALEAFSGGLSTLDLSAASDTISRELVFHLLPLDWALFLDALRSPEILVDGEWVRTEKFASMGNAFTFELETLIFWALAGSASECLGSVDGVTVYGDDLIVPRKAYDLVVEILSVCGFSVNDKKSFKDGPFYESCGEHYHTGQGVTPVYQKELLQHPSELIRAHNRILRLASRILNPEKRDSFGVRAARTLRDAFPFRPLPQIPQGCVEDGGFLRPLTFFKVDPNRGYKCHVLDYVPRYSLGREDAMYAYKLRRRERLNPEKSGQASNVTKGRYRMKVRHIPVQSTIAGPAAPDVRVLLGLDKVDGFPDYL